MKSSSFFENSVEEFGEDFDGVLHFSVVVLFGQVSFLLLDHFYELFIVFSEAENGRNSFWIELVHFFGSEGYAN